MVKIKIPSTAVTGNKTGILNGPLNKLWRAKILLNRKLSGMPQNKGDVPKKIGRISPPINEHFQEINRLKLINEAELRHRIEDTPLAPQLKRTIHNQIIIINPNTSPYTKIEIQGKPGEIEISPDSNWASVKSMGRNNPFMMYLGGEDTVSFEISWFSTQKDRQDVINKCKLLESWSRADGYTSSPPILYISWGSANIFRDQAFVLVSAKYTLTNFQNSCRSNFDRRKPGNPIDLGLLPNCAVQKLVFKKVTSNNTTHDEIISRNALKTTNGVTL